MNKIVCMLGLVFLLLILFGSFDDRPEYIKMVHRAIYNVANEMEKRHQLQSSGMIEAGRENCYTKVGMHFHIYRPLTKNEGRMMLLEIAQILLNELNLNSQLEPYLKPYPFTINNIEIVLIAYYPDKTQVYHPDVVIFTLSEGTIRYVTDIPELKYQHHTEESESVEEAIKIVHPQQADSING